MEIQARIPPALCALHNFIRHHDPTDVTASDFKGVESELEDGEHGEHGEREEHGELSTSSVGPPERERAGTRRDQIAHEMWDQYQQWLESGGDE